MANAANVQTGQRTPRRARARWSQRWALLLTAMWAALLVGAIAGTITSALQIEQSYRVYVQPFLAFGLRPGEADNKVWIYETYGRPGGPAAVPPTGLILSVDGHPAPTAYNDRHKVARLLSDAPGPIVAIRMRSPDGMVRDYAIQRSGAWVATAYAGTGLTRHTLWIEKSIALVLVHAIQIVAAIVLFIRARRHRVAALLSVSFLLMAASGVDSIPAYIDPLWGSFALAPPLLGALGYGGLLLAMLVFPDGRFHPRWSRWVLPLLVAHVVVTALYGYGLFAAPWTGAAFASLLLLTVALQVWRYRRLSPGVQRQQIRWTLFGAACAGICLAAIFAMEVWRARAVGDLMLWAWLGAAVPVLILVGPGAHMSGLFVSLLRYRLYDADAVVSRSAAFALITLVLAALWAGAERGLEVVFHGSLGHEGGAFSVGLAATFAALFIKPVHERVHRWTEQVFQKGLSHLRRDLPACMADLRETASVAKLAAVALERVSGGLSATRGAIAIRDGFGLKLEAVHGVSVKTARPWLRATASGLVGQALQRGEASDLFPLRLPLTIASDGPRETVGWLLLGPRPDGSFYGKDELEALQDVADPVARALHVVRIRQARERIRDRRMADLTSEVAALRNAIYPAASAPAGQ